MGNWNSPGLFERLVGLILLAMVLWIIKPYQFNEAFGHPFLPITKIIETNRVRLKYQHDTKNFRLNTNLKNIDLKKMGKIAERVRSKMQEWLGKPETPLPNQKPRDIYFCKDREEVIRLEKKFNYSRSEDPKRDNLPILGGFYFELQLICFSVEDRKNLRINLAHEISHAVFADYSFGWGSDPIDEGLATLVSSCLYHLEMRPLKTCKSKASNYQKILRNLVSKNQILPLETLFSLDYFEFRSKEYSNNTFALSWSLVKFLMETKNSKLAGKLPKFMAELKKWANDWVALQEVYDVKVLEAHWKTSIKRMILK